MGEYDRRQQKQESRAIANNGRGSGQLKKVVDNRPASIISQMMLALKSPTTIPVAITGVIDNRINTHGLALTPSVNAAIRSATATGKRKGKFNIPFGSNWIGFTVSKSTGIAHVAHYGPFGKKTTTQL